MRGFFKWIIGLAVLAGGAYGALQWIGSDNSLIHIRFDDASSTTTPSLGVAAATIPAEVAAAQATNTAAPPAATLPPQPTATLAPAGTEVAYSVQPGDTLTGIAAQFDTTVEAISTRNGITDPSTIFVGAVLKIVVGERPAVAEVPPTAPLESTAAPLPTATLPNLNVFPTNTPAPAGALQATRPIQNPAAYDVYIPTATKGNQYFHYTCEFDAGWAILKTYGIEADLQTQLGIVGQDTSVEPTYKEVPGGAEIYGGDIANFYSGNYETNFLARTTGSAMRKVFEHYDLRVTPVHSQEEVEAALRSGELIWIKTTVDFKSWVPATWYGPDGRTFKTVLGNDHAVVVSGFNADAVVIRDVLGPTSTNASRLYEYEVSWPTFLAAWGAQDYDGEAVARPNAP